MSKERRLGRGLEALLGRPLDQEGSSATPEGPTTLPIHSAASSQSPSEETSKLHDSDSNEPPIDGACWIGIYEIDRNPYQPRVEFDETEIQSLSESVIDHGMLQPLVVRRIGDRYELISGERRWRAATVAGWEKVPAQVREADDRQMAEWAIVENVQRKDLSPLEKAASFQRYLEQYQCTQEELASRVKVDRSTIANLIRLLELPEAVQGSLRAGSISQGHARALLPLGEESEQIAFCKKIQADGLSVRATEELVHNAIRDADDEPLGVFDGNTGSAPAKENRKRGDHLASLEQELRRMLGTKIEIRQTRRGSGRIVVHFKNNEEFERLKDHLAGSSSQRAAG